MSRSPDNLAPRTVTSEQLGVRADVHALIVRAFDLLPKAEKGLVKRAFYDAHSVSFESYVRSDNSTLERAKKLADWACRSEPEPCRFFGEALRGAIMAYETPAGWQLEPSVIGKPLDLRNCNVRPEDAVILARQFEFMAYNGRASERARNAHGEWIRAHTDFLRSPGRELWEHLLVWAGPIVEACHTYQLYGEAKQIAFYALNLTTRDDIEVDKDKKRLYRVKQQRYAGLALKHSSALGSVPNPAPFFYALRTLEKTSMSRSEKRPLRLLLQHEVLRLTANYLGSMSPRSSRFEDAVLGLQRDFTELSGGRYDLTGLAGAFRRDVESSSDSNVLMVDTMGRAFLAMGSVVDPDCDPDRHKQYALDHSKFAKELLHGNSHSMEHSWADQLELRAIAATQPIHVTQQKKAELIAKYRNVKLLHAARNFESFTVR